MSANTTYQSRFGYHSCDKDTYLKLKRLKKLFWEAVRAYGAWRRWDRKQPENRFYWEPRADRTQKRRRSDRPIPEPLTCSCWPPLSSWETSMLNDRGLLRAFDIAKTPWDKPENVKPLPLTIEQIDKLLEVAEGWSAERKEIEKR